MERQRKTLDERFTDLADTVSQMMGSWKLTAFFLAAILLWAAFGPFMHFSDSWQLWVNTPTTIIELFCECFILAAANRVERRHDLLLREIQAKTSADEATTKRDAEVNRKSEAELQVMKADIQAIKKAVLR